MAIEAKSLVAITGDENTATFRQVIDNFQDSLLQAHPDIEFVFSNAQSDEKKLQQAKLIFALGPKAVQDSIAMYGNQNLLATLLADKSLLENSGNSTGIVLKTSILTQLQWHKRILPNVKRIGIFYDPQYNFNWVTTAASLANQLGLQIIAIPVTSSQELPFGFRLLKNKVGSLLSIRDRTVYSSRTAKAILLFSFRNQIPLIGYSKAWVKLGALYALDWDYVYLGQHSASLAARILSGEKAGSIPIQIIEKPDYFLNLKTAKYMQLNLNPELVEGANELYE